MSLLNPSASGCVGGRKGKRADNQSASRWLPPAFPMGALRAERREPGEQRGNPEATPPARVPRRGWARWFPVLNAVARRICVLLPEAVGGPAGWTAPSLSTGNCPHEEGGQVGVQNPTAGLNAHCAGQFRVLALPLLCWTSSARSMLFPVK